MCIKEGVRSVLAGLPYTCPRALFRLLVPFVALRLNMFPTSTRTDRLSAFQIIYNRPADAHRDCHLNFGEMYHVTCRERSHSMAPRTVAAISVAQIPNGSGLCSFYAIHNGTIISANHFTAVPMTPYMIRHMNRLAANDKVPTAINAPYYLHGKALLGPPPIETSSFLPPSREPAATTGAPASMQEPPAQDQPIEEGSNEDINTEQPPEPALAKGLQQSLWTRTFLMAQGLRVPPILVYQDNQSTIKLLERGRPAAEQTRDIDIGCFWLTDLLARGVITIEYCPTLDMLADLFTKPLQGSLFQTMRDHVLGTTNPAVA
jgi:hypothetical protein